MIFCDGFLSAGENFRAYGFNGATERIALKTRERENLKINFKGSYYTAVLTDSSGAYKKMSGSVPNDDNVNIRINMIYSSVKIDDNLKLDITIQNESDKTINVKLTDKQGRVNIFNRNNNKIIKADQSENVSIL